MAAMIWDSEVQAWKESTEVPMRWDPESEARVETNGYRHDGEAWTEAWSPSADLIEGETYTFGGVSWIAAEVDNKAKTAVLQSKGVTSGYWPGCKMSGTLYNATGSITLSMDGSSYTGDIDGYDISNYDTKTKNLYSSIKEAENTRATYGRGLYLVGRLKVVTSDTDATGTGQYWKALTAAASNTSLGNGAYLGTHSAGNYVYYVANIANNGHVNSNADQYGSYVVAPAFNLDASKVKIKDNVITLK
jgi:hypothetical protein